MAAPITPISGAAIPAIRPAGQSPGGSGFQDVLNAAIQKVEGFNQEASASVQRFLGGQGEELHNTIMATEQATLSFDLFVQVRNKVVTAYQQIMQMQM